MLPDIIWFGDYTRFDLTILSSFGLKEESFNRFDAEFIAGKILAYFYGGAIVYDCILSKSKSSNPSSSLGVCGVLTLLFANY